MNAIASNLKHHARAVGKRVHDGHELEVDVFFPDLKRGDEEVVDTGNGGGLEQKTRLRSAFFACNQNLCNRRGFRVGKQAVHVAHKIAPQRDEEENAEAPACEADEDGLHGVRIEIEDVERGKGEYGARHHASRGAGDAGDNDVLK